MDFFLRCSEPSLVEHVENSSKNKGLVICQRNEVEQNLLHYVISMTLSVTPDTWERLFTGFAKAMGNFQVLDWKPWMPMTADKDSSCKSRPPRGMMPIPSGPRFHPDAIGN